MKCPDCKSNIFPLKTLLISALWSIKCKKCKKLLNRKRDLQFFAMSAVYLLLIFLFVALVPINSILVKILLALLVASIIDAYTIKLVIKEKK